MDAIMINTKIWRNSSVLSSLFYSLRWIRMEHWNTKHKSKLLDEYYRTIDEILQLIFNCFIIIVNFCFFKEFYPCITCTFIPSLKQARKQNATFFWKSMQPLPSLFCNRDISNTHTIKLSNNSVIFVFCT